MKIGILVHPEELSKSWIDRMVSGGIDTLGIHPAGGPKAHETLEELLRLCKTKEFKDLIDYARGKGLNVEYEFHAASYLLKRRTCSL